MQLPKIKDLSERNEQNMEAKLADITNTLQEDCEDVYGLWDPSWFGKTPPSFLVGYAYQRMRRSNNLRVRLTRTGVLPEKIQNDQSVKIVAKVGLKGSKNHKNVCIVRSGKPQNSQSVNLTDICWSNIKSSSLEFTLYFDKGLFRRKQVIAKWAVPLTKCEMVRETYDWQDVEFCMD